MIITLNDYVINNAGSKAYISDDIEGLSLPPIRTSSGNYAGRDGGYVGAQFFAARPITLTGRIFSSDVNSLESARTDIQTALHAPSITMKIVTSAGKSYVIYCKLLDFKMPINRDLFTAPFKIELLAPDPVIYDDATGTELTASISRIVSGGYSYPVVYPVVYAISSLPATVTNAGTASVKPKITLTGIMTNPVLQNRTTGEQLQLNLTTGVGDVVVIDMQRLSVLLNGGDIFATVAASSIFWRLITGPNSIALTTGSGGDTVAGVISWRAGFVGI